jgi:hypothetical protein
MASGDDNPRWYSISLDKNIGTKGYDQYTAEHYFLDYAAQQWAVHFREAKVVKHTALLKSVAFKICDTRNMRFSTWFLVHWGNFSPDKVCPNKFTDLMIASYFGLEGVVQLLLELKANVNCMDIIGRTPLLWAARNGHKAVVKQLLERTRMWV